MWISGLLLALGAYVAVLAALWWGQEVLLFQPQVLGADAPLPTGPDIHEHRLPVDGAELSVMALRLPQPRGVVLYLHGNGGSLQSWFTNLDLYREAGYDLVMPDYRGYGKSSGRIRSEAQLHADVMAVWQAVAPRYAGRRVVLVGRSLGSGLAAQLATQIQPDLTVLVSPYQSMQALAAQQYPWVPGAVLRYPLRTDLALPQIRGPVQLIHGDQDALIPIQHSRALLPLGGPQVSLHPIAGAAHNDLQEFPAYRAALKAALQTAAAPVRTTAQ